MKRSLLTPADHSRDSVDMRYVYPVVSRRAGGVSVGINLNPNNACNWHCVYCQVPDLKRGGPPPLDLPLLAEELGRFLDWAVQGDFMATRVPSESRRLVDVAFSGNGEPTSAPEFSEAVACVESVLAQHGLRGALPLRLITNGSMLDRKVVQAGIARLSEAAGEVWFKIDAATGADIIRINGTRAQPYATVRRLLQCCGLAPTWVQTCLFRIDGCSLGEASMARYYDLISAAAKSLAGVHLYSLARPSMQAEAARLAPLTMDELEAVAEKLRKVGLTVKVSP